MKLVQGRLEKEAGIGPQFVTYGSTKNCGPALPADQVFFILAHWTGGSTLDSAKTWLSNPVAKASAHFIVGRDGAICQLVDTHTMAWHAGQSSYKALGNGLTYEKINRFSIGIEFVNLGKLKRTQASTYRSDSGRVVPPDDVIAVHNGDVSSDYYQAFPHDQIAAGVELMAAILEAFPSVVELIGHRDVAPERKIDPGPIFPMDYCRAKLFGRHTGEVVV